MGKFLAISVFMTLYACGFDGTHRVASSSPQASPEASPPVVATALTTSHPLTTTTMDSSLSDQPPLHMGGVTAVEPGHAIAGQIEVKVTYTRHCQENVQRLIHEKLPPLSAINPTMAVGVAMGAQRGDCDGPSTLETKTFNVPAVSGRYTFQKIIPWRAGFAHHAEIGMARIKAIKQVSPLANRVDVKVTYVRACHERFKGITRSLIAPLNVDHPHFAIGVLVASNPTACATADVEETATFRMPAARGTYQFLPIAQD